MTRPFYAPILVLWTTVRSLTRTMIEQHLAIGLVVTTILVLLAVVFSFLAFTPVLSPFVYPLF